MKLVKAMKQLRVSNPPPVFMCFMCFMVNSLKGELS